ncbi:hypothetical protein [Polluticoccus soli]|uniref:hypothetical protein n=1 Tax=Polluticoccus soli TaxID=3034150 RepID=UPI0023E33AE4|nr:hypothetical protein [Flavipsychrobacter sp. JY13-12]
MNTLLRGMGSISSAYSNPFAVNTDNPASYSALKLTTYEAGGEGGIRNATTGDQKYSTGSATLSHLNVGIPVAKNAGISFGLRPYSRVYYNLQDSSSEPGLGKIINEFAGSGSTSYGFVGAGGRYKGFSAGFNVGYLFGTIQTAQQLLSIDTVKAHHSAFVNATQLGGIYWKVGAMYDGELNKKLGIRIGATLATTQTIGAERDEYWLLRNSATTTTTYDTALNHGGLEGKTTLPMTYTAGAQLIGTDKWMVGVDYTGTKWSEFRNFGAVDSVEDNYKLSIGGEYTPNMASMTRYFDRVTYRLGLTYGKDYISLRNTDLNYYAVTAGLSLPFRRTTDRIHTALEIGRRGTTSNGLIRETFVRLALGISLNDRWFIKRRYD